MADSSITDNLSPEPETVPEGASTEAPVTRPFEGFTYLRKEWVDQEDDIEKVTFNLTLGALNLPADWSHTQTSIMMPEWGSVPLRRTWIVRLPTHFEGNEQYLIHYFFQVFHRSGGELVSHTFTQLMVPHQFEFIDHSGDVTHVSLHWSVGRWLYPQDTELEVEGIEWGSEFSVIHALYRSNDPLYEKGRSLLMRHLAIPRYFRCKIWAPKGAEVFYCFKTRRGTFPLLAGTLSGRSQNAPPPLPEGRGNDAEIHWDNNFGKDYSLTI